MRRHEAAHGALLDDVLCGRPAGHNGPCRSPQSLAKALELDRKRWPAEHERRRQRRRREVLAAALREADGYVAGQQRRHGRAA